MTLFRKKEVLEQYWKEADESIRRLLKKVDWVSVWSHVHGGFSKNPYKPPGFCSWHKTSFKCDLMK